MAGFSYENVMTAPTAAAASPQPNLLTRREVAVLRLMAEGLTTKEIATRLDIQFKTAACHRSRVLQKLGVKSTVCAVLWAIRQNLVEI
jgi:DNA-binding NarL/FixJ family response regulator